MLGVLKGLVEDPDWAVSFLLLGGLDALAGRLTRVVLAGGRPGDMLRWLPACELGSGAEISGSPYEEVNGIYVDCMPSDAPDCVPGKTLVQLTDNVGRSGRGSDERDLLPDRASN